MFIYVVSEKKVKYIMFFHQQFVCKKVENMGNMHLVLKKKKVRIYTNVIIIILSFTPCSTTTEMKSDNDQILDKPFYYSKELISQLQEQIADDKKTFSDLFAPLRFDSALFDEIIINKPQNTLVSKRFTVLKDQLDTLIKQFFNHLTRLHQHIDRAFQYVQPWVFGVDHETPNQRRENLMSPCLEDILTRLLYNDATNVSSSSSSNKPDHHMFVYVAMFAVLEILFKSIKVQWKMFRKQAKCLVYHPPERKSDNFYATLKTTTNQIKTMKRKCRNGVLESHPVHKELYHKNNDGTCVKN